ncbi:hypothetical protein N0V83_006055 [Neocucurbitaria cava]|uniref:F-box domain-containing protein n=1 Tax=Neocucurbitaria cava TaxID=798079 RepID=A0A9W8Y5Z6_9PLEO|nr:hypothetical protein N0V83_006055 [Neocucurbitaria cava]
MATHDSTAASPPPDDYPRMLCMPVEMHDAIFNELKLSDAVAGNVYGQRLRQTNRYFFGLIELIDPPDHNTLLYLEKTPWAEDNDIFTCKYCLTLRHKSAFGDGMLQGNRARGGCDSKKRFCADCGFDVSASGSRYPRSTDTMVNGERWVWCRDCRKVKKGDEAGLDICQQCCRDCYGAYGCACEKKEKCCSAEKRATTGEMNREHKL